MKKVVVLIFFGLSVVACSEPDPTAQLAQRALAEQEAKEGSNVEHYKVQEEAARTHKEK